MTEPLTTGLLITLAVQEFNEISPAPRGGVS